MGCFSKFQYLDGTCQELGHTWTPSCWQSCYDVSMNCIRYSLQIYTPIHLNAFVIGSIWIALYEHPVSSLASHGFNISIPRVIKGILQSSAFLSTNGCLMIGFFCLLRHLFGKFYFLSVGLFPGFLCSLCAILLEQKSRRGLLALYMLGVAVETLFNILVNHGMAKKLGNGEVIIFVTAMACIMYFFRKNLLPEGLIKKIIRLLLNEKKGKVPQDVKELASVDTKKLYAEWLRHGLKVFGVSSALHAAPGVLLSMGKLLSKPGYLMEALKLKDSFMFGAFLSSFSLLYRFSEHYLEKYRGKNEKNSIIAGGIAALSFLFNKSSSIAVYFMSKVAEVVYKEISKRGYAPWFSSADILLYALATGIMFHAAVLEPHSLRPAYWKFLLRLTGGKFQDVNRKRLDPFGCHSSKLFPDFDPIIPASK